MTKDSRNFYKEIEIHFYECDMNKKAKIHTLLRYMTDIAGIAYANSCMTHQELWDIGFVFLISRVSIKIHRNPVADEKLLVETWESAINGVQFIRDFAIYDKDDNKIVEAETAWIVVDPHKRSIVKPKDFTGKFSTNSDCIVETLPTAKLKLPKEFVNQGERKICYTDIDANQHVNNAIYASIVCDFLPIEILSKNITDFRINFKQEAVLGEELTIKSSILDDTAFVVGELEDKVSFEAEIKWA